MNNNREGARNGHKNAFIAIFFFVIYAVLSLNIGDGIIEANAIHIHTPSRDSNDDILLKPDRHEYLELTYGTNPQSALHHM